LKTYPINKFLPKKKNPLQVSQQGGFALVVALSMMSFVLVLLLSITVLVSVETKNASRSLDQLLARENARLGMLVAVGNLQKLMGPDQRVSIRANALIAGISETTVNGYWTGIMEADSPTNDLAEIDWLVSTPDGLTSSPIDLLDDTNSAKLTAELELEIPDPGNPGGVITITVPAVRAPLREINESGSQSFAYWVSDESMKASIATRPEIDAQEGDWLDDSFGASTAKRLDQVIPKRAGIEMLFAPNGEGSQAELGQLSKIDSLSQMQLTTAWDFSNFGDFVHDITDRSFGILASTTGTGLKNDLSLRPDLMPIPGGFESVYDYESYMEEPLPAFSAVTPYIPYEDDLRRRYKITAPTTTTLGEINDGISPVITDFRILFHVHVAGDAVVSATGLSINPITDREEIVIRAQIYLELWNPYTSALVPENLILEISGLPDVTMAFPGARGQPGPTFTISLDDALSNGGSGNEGFFIELPFEDREIDSVLNTDDLSWLPGRVYSWVGPNTFSGGSAKTTGVANFYSRTLDDGVWYEGTGLIAPVTASTFGLTAPDSSLTVALRKKSTGGQIDSGPELLRVENINYQSFDNPPSTFNKTNRPLSFGYQIQRNESGFVTSKNPWEKSRWLRIEDPRNPRPLFDDVGDGIGAFQGSRGTNPVDYTTTGVKQPAFLFDRTAGTVNGFRPSEDIPLFELFRHRPISIGELQHLHLIDERPFSIGNSWGSTDNRRYNRIFDEAFFSGLGEDDTSPDPTNNELFPNHRLRTVAGIANSTAPTLNTILNAGEDSAQYFVTEGAFNVNSTSANAWAAILGSMYFEEFEVVNIDDSSGEINTEDPRKVVNIGQAILRFPQSAQEVFHTGVYEDPFQPPTEFFRMGAKHFGDSSATNDTAPFTELGMAIATRIKERVEVLGPFTSMEEFLSPVELPNFGDPNEPGENLSLLERAILDVSELNTSVDEGEVWHHTSSFLSQADVMTGIAPIASVRGDTFYIRAVGLSQDGLSAGNKVTVICEARIQRIPQTVDPSDDILQPDETGFGRQFRITSLRWIDTL
jgi:hypothetical protein